jgi:serine protease Do
MRPSLLLVVLLASGGCREQTGGFDAGTVGPSDPQTAPRVVQPSTPSSFVQLVDGARHAVVGIRATNKVKSGPASMFPGAPDAVPDDALGTGFLIEARGVYVLTNDHIAAGAIALKVVLASGQEAPAKVIGRDAALDLALLAIERPAKLADADERRQLRPLQLGNSDELRVGQWIVVVGNPFGDGVTATAGIVSSTGHETASLLESRALTHRGFLQTDARIHRGNSGGPLLDTAGQVVGVAVATTDRPTELSFAIPINRVKEIVNTLREHGEVARSWLGVLVKPLTLELSQRLGASSIAGALVTEVKPGSPAARYALRVGDVILQWGTTKVDHRSLPWLVAGTPVGKQTDVIVWRDKAERTIRVTTEKMPE